jgi:transcriptional regulator with XRE-family HTH domain
LPVKLEKYIVLRLLISFGYALLVQTKFGMYMRTLRKQRGLTLKQVEKAAGVSNAYVSQFERGLRNPPHPEILNRLAKVYDVPARELMVAAGYLTDDAEAENRRKIELAYNHVTSDPNSAHGTRLKGASLTLDAKRFIVEMYEKMTGRKLLESA